MKRQNRNAGNALLAFSLISSSFHATFAEIPQGFEVIDVVGGDNFFHRPRINNCGEFVYYMGFPADSDSEIYLYDNGKLTQLTDNDVADSYPHINDDRAITWTRNSDLNGNGDICFLKNNELEVIDFGSSPSLNSLNLLTFERAMPATCAFEADIYLYNGKTTLPVSSLDGRSNQTPQMNDFNQIIWTSYDFSSCTIADWTSIIKMYDNDMIIDLPSSLETPQSVDINNQGHAVWGDFDFVEIWDGQSTRVLAEGAVAQINDLGDVAFLRWSPYWVAWVYFRGEFYQISEFVPPMEAGRLDINNDGEVVMGWGHNGLDPLIGGIKFMRRIRNGDFDLDRDIDAQDTSIMTNCLTGPGDFDRLCSCRYSDMGHDRDVDLTDWASFQNTFSHPQYPGHDCCNDEHGPGCNDEDVEACVCNVNPTCCSNAWDSTCVVLIDLLGCGECP